MGDSHHPVHRLNHPDIAVRTEAREYIEELLEASKACYFPHGDKQVIDLTFTLDAVRNLNLCIVDRAPHVSHEQAEHDTLVAMQRVMYGLSALLEGQWLMYKTRPYKAFSVDWVLGDAFPRAYQAWDGQPYRSFHSCQAFHTGRALPKAALVEPLEHDWTQQGHFVVKAETTKICRGDQVMPALPVLKYGCPLAVVYNPPAYKGVNVQDQIPVQPHRVRVLRNVPEPGATGHHLDYDAETSEKAVYIDTFEPPPTSAPQGKVHIGWRWGIHLKLARSGKYEKAVEPEEAFNIKFNGSSYVLRSPEELQVVVEHSAYTPTSRT